MAACAAASVLLAVVGATSLVDSGELGAAIAGSRERMAGPGLFAVVGLLLLAERRWPARERRALGRAALVDAFYLALFAVALVPALTLLYAGVGVEIARHAPFLELGRLRLVPQVVVAAVTLVAIDAVNWLCHLANHRFAWMWRLHALHHSQEEMGVLTTFRTHPLVHATYLPALVPAVLFGASGTVPGLALVAYGCLVAAAHANLRFGYGPLGRVLVSPAYHRLHHASAPSRGGPVNLGFVLTLWDRLAGRAVLPTGAEEPLPTGLVDRPVPVEQAVPGRRVPAVVAAQLVQPFRLRPFGGAE